MAKRTARWKQAATSPLLTDLYQLTMLEAYLGRGMHDTAVFEFFARRLPKTRNFLLAAGLEQLLDYLEALSFSDEDLGALADTGRFSDTLLDYLADFRFSGEVRAMPEGTACFEDEPIVQVIAPLPEAQLIETRLINLLHFQTLVASKAARAVLAAPGKSLVDFGLRRAHGAEAGLLAARSAYIAGFAGTATVLAEPAFGIPIFGTMAHSYVQAHDDELDAFEHFARTYPDGTVLLIDTYDTLAAAENVVRLAKRLSREGIRIAGVRLDSGNMVRLAQQVRQILDDGGFGDITIFVSGSLDEERLANDFAGLPIDGFGIGTRLDVSADAPYLDCAYKLQEYAGKPRRKRSSGKSTLPGRKQVFRLSGADGIMLGDTVAEEHELVDGTPLLEPVMRDGRRIDASPSIEEVRQRAAASLAALPPSLRNPLAQGSYDVKVSAKLEAMAAEVDSRQRDRGT